MQSIAARTAIMEGPPAQLAKLVRCHLHHQDQAARDRTGRIVAVISLQHTGLTWRGDNRQLHVIAKALHRLPQRGHTGRDTEHPRITTRQQIDLPRQTGHRGIVHRHIGFVVQQADRDQDDQQQREEIFHG
jgi:hypothetical protein